MADYALAVQCCETKAESVLLVSAVQGFCCFCSLPYAFRYVFVASSTRTCKNSSAHPRPNISAEGLHFSAFSLSTVANVKLIYYEPIPLKNLVTTHCTCLHVLQHVCINTMHTEGLLTHMQA